MGYDSSVRNRQKIEAWLPFVFSQELDPRSILTVGDQVASEHLFAFHSRESIRGGFSSVLSEVNFDETNATMTVRPRFPLRSSAGKKITIDGICSAFQSSLCDASHSIIASLVNRIECLPDSFRVEFSRIPVNIRYLLTLADFSVFEPQSLPLSPERTSETTGPYSVRTLDSRKITLQLNPEYPSALRANSIPDVELKSYSANDTRLVIEQALEATPAPLLYFYGYSLAEEDLERLRASRFRLREVPSEWVVYAGISPSVSFKDRLLIASVLDRSRDSLTEDQPLSQPAYSVSPQDRPYGLGKSEYAELTQDLAIPSGAVSVSRKYRIVTLDEWATIPVFKETIARLKASFPNFEVHLLPRARVGELWSTATEIAISPMGIAPADPLNNFGFMEEFRHLISKEELASASLLSDPSAFNAKLKEFESRVVRDRIWIPIAHYSSIVAEPDDLERDEELAWSWGIQTWTYRVR